LDLGAKQQTTLGGVDLIVKNLNVTYKLGASSYSRAVKDMHFALARGEILGIIGESGAGKSTVGWGILGMIMPPHKIEGQIIANGKDVLGMNQHELNEYRWRDVSMIFQSAMNSLDPVITIGKNFSQLLNDKEVVTSRSEARTRISELLEMVGLRSGTADMYPFELSGGMKQRISIAAALSTSPRILVADEPTTALDTLTQFSILTLLLELKKSGKIGSMILISHDLSVQAYLVDRAMVMLKGYQVEIGTKAEIFKAPKHPYTQFLMSTLALGRGQKAAKPAKRVRPPIATGCPFAQFCPYTMEKCYNEFPKETKVSDTQSVYCFLYS
jgi:oligopeptide/dipeptide ABC transporter ATP-binding protein